MSKKMVKDFLEFAIANEQNAAALYTKYSQIAQSNSIKDLLSYMAQTEQNHEARLKELQSKTSGLALDQEIQLDLPNYTGSIKITEESNLSEVFKFAIESEQKAQLLYTHLSEQNFDETVKSFFASLASDEKQHESDLQNEYEKEFRAEFDF